MVYFSFNDFVDCKQSGEIYNLKRIEENIIKYEHIPSTKIPIMYKDNFFFTITPTLKIYHKKREKTLYFFYFFNLLKYFISFNNLIFSIILYLGIFSYICLFLLYRYS